MEVKTNNLEEFNSEATRFANTLEAKSDVATLVALSGELGAGKTAFVQSVAKSFGITQTVSSPTFVIEKVYELSRETRSRLLAGRQGFARLIHIDAYRLEKPEELEHLGWKDIISKPENLIFLEWPERVPSVIPKSTYRVVLKGEGEGRIITYEKTN